MAHSLVCQRLGCDQPAEVLPRIYMRMRLPSMLGQIRPVYMNLPTCNACAKGMKPADFAAVEPDKAVGVPVRIIWISLEDGEAREWLRMWAKSKGS